MDILPGEPGPAEHRRTVPDRRGSNWSHRTVHLSADFSSFHLCGPHIRPSALTPPHPARLTQRDRCRHITPVCGASPPSPVCPATHRHRCQSSRTRAATRADATHRQGEWVVHTPVVSRADPERPAVHAAPGEGGVRRRHWRARAHIRRPLHPAVHVLRVHGVKAGWSRARAESQR